MSERRWRLLTGLLSEGQLSLDQVDKVIKIDGIDNSLCPYATLPKDWNSYLDTLSTNTRQKIRRLLKQVEASGEYRITVATPETFDRDLKTLLGFWETKWRARKADRIDSLVQSNGAMLTRSFHSGHAVPADLLAWRPAGRGAGHAGGAAQADVLVLHDRT